MAAHAPRPADRCRSRRGSGDGHGAGARGRFFRCRPGSRGTRSPRPRPGTSGKVGVDDFDYYGHHQFFAVSDAGLDLGCIPAEPVNDFRSAEKFLLRDGDYEDVTIEVDIDLLDAQRSAGVLFRTTAPTIGFDTQRGYYACLALDTHDLVLGRTDGEQWTTTGDGEAAGAARPGPAVDGDGRR